MSRSPPRIDIRRHFIAAGFTGRSELEDGSSGDFVNGLLHAEGRPARTLKDGTRLWYQYGMLHRDGGPAVEGNGREEYWHRGRPCHAHAPSPDGTAEKRNDTLPRLLASKPEI